MSDAASSAPGDAPNPSRPIRVPSVIRPERVRSAAVISVAFAAVLVAVQIVNALASYRLNQYGIMPRTASGLWGVLAAPLLHTSWPHLLANIIPTMVFVFFIAMSGARQLVAVTALVWLLAGFGLWLTGPSGRLTVGASVLVFGWLAFLALRGVFTRRFAQILLGAVLLALWGGIFWGALPGAEGISWQGHVFGAVTGAVAAYLAGKADRAAYPAITPGTSS